jgi:hypothetical protein
MNSAVTCIYTICEEDVKASPDTRIVHWVLMCRCIALNTRSTGRADDAEADGGAQAGAPADGKHCTRADVHATLGDLPLFPTQHAVALL